MSSLLKPIEFILNAALRHDSEIKDKLIEFQDRSITIELTDFDYAVSAHFIDTDISLSTADDCKADLTISGNSLALVKLGQNPENLFSKDIAIHGDVQFAKQLQNVLEQFEFDWEALLARFSGDTLAYPIAQGIRNIANWAKQNHQSIQLTIAEYLREEARLLPDKAEITPYLNDIDSLRADLDRLEARLKRLEG